MLPVTEKFAVAPGATTPRFTGAPPFSVTMIVSGLVEQFFTVPVNGISVPGGVHADSGHVSAVMSTQGCALHSTFSLSVAVFEPHAFVAVAETTKVATPLTHDVTGTSKYAVTI